MWFQEKIVLPYRVSGSSDFKIMKTKRNLIHICLLCAMLLARFAAEAQPVITQQLTNQTVIVGGSATFNVAVSGTGPFTYQWQFNGTNLSNPLVTTIISTIAGNGIRGFSGDGGYATNAQLFWPSGVAVDGGGNVFIADSGNNRIRAVSSMGGIVSDVGNGGWGYVNNGLTYGVAELAAPSSLAIGAGNVFFANSGSSTIQKSPAVVGEGVGWPITVAGVAWTNGYSGDGGLATNAELNIEQRYAPEGVAIDGNGNVFIADGGNNRIRKVSTNGIITTVAGSGSTGDSWGGFSGDGGLATSAKLNEPSGVAVDRSGNVFIADTFNNRIRKVSTNGIITTVAGSGNAGSYFGGYSGDGGLATNAELNVPYGVAIDGSGNVFIADSGNNRIRIVSTNGIISTDAGNGTNGFSGDGGSSTSAAMSNPTGVAVDGLGNVFIADEYNERIREVINSSKTPSLFLNSVSTNNAGNYSIIITSSSGSVTSSVASLTVLVPPSIVTQPVNQRVAFSGTATFSVTASGGDLSYQWCSNSVNILNATNAILTLNNVQTNAAASYSVIVTNIAGSVTSSNATLTVLLVPNIVTQPVNQVVVAGGNATFSVTASGTGPFTYQWQLNGTNLPVGIISTVAGIGTGLYSGVGYSGDGGAATNAELYWPYGVAIDGGGNVFIADTWNNRIRKVSKNGIITTVAGNGTGGFSGDGGAATNAKLYQPYGVAVDGSGNVFIADNFNNRIRKVFTNGIISTIAGDGYVGHSGDGGAATNAELTGPFGVAVDAVGNLFIADWENCRIRKVTTNGIISTVAGIGTNMFSGIGYSGDGGAATNAELNNPTGIAVDGVGNLFIADSGNYVIRKVSTNGIISTIAGNGTSGYSGDGGYSTNALLGNPIGIAVDGVGNLFIADRGNSRILEIVTNGIINTVAGNGTNGFSGDGGASTSAEMNPNGVSIDGGGNLFIAEWGNSRIRKVSYFSVSDNPLLMLNFISTNNAGNYSVVITSSSGSVTSCIANLMILPTGQCQILSPASFINGSASLLFAGSASANYALDRSFSLSPVNWIPQATNRADINGAVTFTNTVSTTTNRSCFWRIRSVP